MAPIVIALGLGALLLLVTSKGKKTTVAPNAPDVDTGIRRGVASATHTTGRSGTQWDVQMVESPTKPLPQGGSAVMQVILNDPKIPARKHMVIEYMQTGAIPNVRTLVKTGPSTPGLIQAAIADFGVTGPAAEKAAGGKSVTPPGPGTPAVVVPPGKVLIEKGSYVANVDVAFPASVLATSGLLEKGIAGKGFSEVHVVDEKPAGWPLPGEADYYAHVSWQNSPTLFDLPKQVAAHRKIT